MRDLISKRTRKEFRELLVEWTLREIAFEFENEDFVADKTYVPPESGARRSYVEQFYKNIDFRNPDQVSRLLRVYDSVLLTVDRTNPQEADHLRSSLRRDRCKEVDGAFVLPPDAAQITQFAALTRLRTH